MSRVPTAPIREAVLQHIHEGNTWSDICRRLGWIRYEPHKKDKPESERLRRALGLAGEKRRRQGKVKKLTDKTMNQELAIKIIRAINRAPNEFDL